MPFMGCTQIWVTWSSNNIHLGKIYVNQMESGWQLCADMDAPGDFQYWTIRYYGYYPEVINDTLYETCIYIDTADMNWRELAIICWYIPKLSIQEIDEKQLSIYPNPCHDMLYLKGILEEVYIYDSKGRLLMVHKGNRLNISGYSPGVYVLKNKGKVYKILKK